MRLAGVRMIGAVTLASLLILSASSTRAVTVDLNGQLAPDFVLKSMSGDNLRLSEYRGEVVLLNFWATWCGPCRQEMALLDEMYNRYKKVGFAMLGVNLDKDIGDAADVALAHNISYPVLFDTKREVSRLYGVDDMPVTVLIDRTGVVRYVHYAYKKSQQEAYIEEIRVLLSE